MIKKQIWLKLFLLCFISIISFVFQKFFPDHFLFSLNTLKTDPFKASIAILPLLLSIPVLVLTSIEKATVRKHLLVLSYIVIFLFLSPQPLVAAGIVLGVSTLFLVEK